MIIPKVEVTNEKTVLIRIDRAQRGVARGLSEGLNAAAIATASYIKRDLLSGQLVRTVTGNLRRAVFSRLINARLAVVGVGREAPYGSNVNDGTRPHVIEPVNAKALRFVIGGRTIFTRRVNHPGIAGRHFMERGLAESRDTIRRIISERIAARMKE